VVERSYPGLVLRPFRQQIDDGILDRAAALFARRGFAKTSVQDVADAVGLSKAGLLHHFPSKDALYAAVLAQAELLGRRALDSVAHLPLGPVRDRRAIEVFADVALAHPGIVALLLAPATQLEAGSDAEDDTYFSALQAFGVDPGRTDPERLVRVLAALAALAVLTLAAHQKDQTTEWRPYVVATCFDALGHSSPGVPSRSDVQVEA
jgi:AcrR family transcriptional regulator